MAKACLLGVDIGTYSSRGVLISEAGDVVARAEAGHTLSCPRPGFAEHDAERTWWDDFRLICANLLAAPEGRGCSVAGVGISTISPAVVPVDVHGAPLRPAILYGIDTRATEEMAELGRLTGVRQFTQSAAPKVMWIRRREPQVWRRTARIVNGSGYLLLRLTGESAIDVYDATVFSPFFDTATLTWSADLSSTVAPIDMMPRVTWTCEVAGRITREAARDTGLAAGTPVITGTADAAAEAVGAGVFGVGDMMVMYGSSTFFLLRTAGPAAVRSFWQTPFLEPDTFAVAGGTSTAGSLTRWFRDTLAPEELAAEGAGGPNAYQLLMNLAASAPAGSRGLIALPYFSGERTPIHDPTACGVFFGLSLRHTRADIYRAILESVGYSVRHNIEELEREGCRVHRLFAVGGGTRNHTWMQMVSDITGLPQSIARDQGGAAYGDALLAGMGIGLFRGTDLVRRRSPPEISVQPHRSAHATYDRLYRIYRELYTRTADLMRELAPLGGEGGSP